MFVCALCEATAAGSEVRRSKRRDLCQWCVDELARAGQGWCSAGRHKVKAAQMSAGKPRCKACEARRQQKYAVARDRSAYGKAWRAAHRDQTLDYGRTYRALKRDVLNERRRAAYWRDPEAARAYSRAQYRKHSDKKRAWRHLAYWRNPERARAASRHASIRRKLAILRGER